MPRQTSKAHLKSLRKLTPSIRELHIGFTDPSKMIFQTGQFVMMHIPQANKNKPIKRAYSIASADHNSKEIKLIIKLIDGGIASEYVKKLNPSVKMEFSGPFGKHFLPNKIFQLS